MSVTPILLPWGDGEYSFRLTYGDFADIQKACDAGPWYISAALAQTGPCRVEYVREPIFIALVSAGMELATARQKVGRFCEQHIEENRLFAKALIDVFLIGDEALGKSLGAALRQPKSTPRGSREARSTSASSTALPAH